MPKLYKNEETHDPPHEEYFFDCPGCEFMHAFVVKWGPKSTENHRKRGQAMPPPTWTFNGDMEKPTFSPSLLYKGKCHLYVRDGKIQFLGDCGHKLAGQTVEMEDV